jgi:hypothetical protein
MQNIIKNISKTLLAAGLLLSATSCEDFLDKQPRAERAESNFYKTESDANEALTSVYDALQWHTVAGFHPLPMLMDIASDDSYAGGGSRTDAPSIIQMDMHNISPSNNGENGGLWKKYYIGINRANILLQKIDGIKASDDFKNNIVGQAKFLRAYFYFDLVRLYENVPLVLKTLTSNDAAVPQANPEDVYSRIAIDLDSAILQLPALKTGQYQGRATKWSAKALLARVYLFHKGVYNKELTAGSKTIDQAAALAHLEDLIQNSGHDLLPNFADVFKKSSEFSVESVFEVSYSDKNPWWDWGYVQGGEGNMQAQMQGPRLLDPAKTPYETGWSFAPVTLSLVNAMQDDPRKDLTILEETAENLPGGLVYGFQHTGYFSKKYSTIREYKGATGQPELNWGNNYRAIRYSDVLLMAAELGSPKAQDYLDKVRGRVGLTSVPVSPDNIFKERRLELALEGHRYWDLLRRGLTVAKTAIDVSGSKGPKFKGDQVDFDVTFKTATKGFFPIPQSEVDITSGVIKQNEGYK